MNQLNQKVENRFVSKLFSLQKIDKNKSFVQKQPPEVFFKESVLKKFHKIQIPVLESFFNKVSGVRPTTLLKKRLQQWFFPVNFVKFLTPFLENTSRRLLLSVTHLTVSFYKEVLYIHSRNYNTNGNNM